jgi:hypothetical protein
MSKVAKNPTALDTLSVRGEEGVLFAEIHAPPRT